MLRCIIDLNAYLNKSIATLITTHKVWNNASYRIQGYVNISQDSNQCLVIWLNLRPNNRLPLTRHLNMQMPPYHHALLNMSSEVCQICYVWMQIRCELVLSYRAVVATVSDVVVMCFFEEHVDLATPKSEGACPIIQVGTRRYKNKNLVSCIITWSEQYLWRIRDQNSTADSGVLKQHTSGF